MATKPAEAKTSASKSAAEPKAKGSLSAYGVARSTVTGAPLDGEALHAIHAYWRACNYLSLGMIYLQDNPLLKQPLKPEHIKNRLLGHWGASPGLSFVYIHLNRLIKKYDLDMRQHGQVSLQAVSPNPVPAIGFPFVPVVRLIGGVDAEREL